MNADVMAGIGSIRVTLRMTYGPELTMDAADAQRPWHPDWGCRNRAGPVHGTVL